MNFIKQISRTINTKQSKSVLLTGNIYDLFFDGEKYVPLIECLAHIFHTEATPKSKGIIQLLYKLNRPVTVRESKNDVIKELNHVWAKFHAKDNETFHTQLLKTNQSSAFSFEIIRQIMECYRNSSTTKNNILSIVECADLLLPESEISRLSPIDRHSISIVHNWLCDPDFMNGHDSVIFLAESVSKVNHKIARLPSLINIDVPLPDLKGRRDFIEHMFQNTTGAKSNENQKEFYEELALNTAGLSLHAIRQLILSGQFTGDHINAKVEDYMVSQLGEGIIEFKKPKHTMKDVVGNSHLVNFINTELIPSFKNKSSSTISGVAVSGPIGGGKTFICEAIASELDMPVIVLKNIRSKWYGETDQIFENLRRLLESFNKIVIFIDEADTIFGDIESSQDTEKRLTGKIQQMMSDTSLKGRVIWFLMTARIHKLSPDIRRPGRIDLIIPVLDPEDKSDIDQFVNWTLSASKINSDVSENDREDIYKATKHYSAAAFALLRNEVKNRNISNILDLMKIIEDIIPPDIEETRYYQTLQAKINCTRKSLLPIKSEDFVEERKQWKREIIRLEKEGLC